MNFVIGLAAAVASAAQATELPPDRRTFETIEHAVIVRQSQRPLFASGITAVWVAFDVEVRGEALQTMFLLYSGEIQFIPPANSVCRIVYTRAFIDGISSRGSLDRREARNVVDELACDTGTTVVLR